MAFDLNQFRTVFFDETAELLEATAMCLVRLEQGGAASEAAREAFRCTHSIKGSSATFGYDDLSGVAGALARVFDALANGRLACDARSLGACRVAYGRLVELVEDKRGATGLPEQFESEALVEADVYGEADAADRAAVADEVSSGSPPLAEMSQAVREIHGMVARMEELAREQAVLATRTETALLNFEQQLRTMNRLVDAMERTSSASMAGAVPTASRTACRTKTRRVGPLPKIRGGHGLADEWEDV